MIRTGKAAIVATAVFFLEIGTGVSQQRPPGLQDYPRRPVPATSQAAVPPGTVKSVTRLITVDVVATDSHGNAVRDLQQSDLQVFDERGGQQKIARFEFIDTSVAPAGPMPGALPIGPHIYSNLQAARLKVPPTAILMDALNTSLFHQMQVRRDMILFLKNLPPDTPVAVFLLGHEVHIVQNFTTDPKLLRAAVDQARRPDNALQEQNPQDDANSASATLEEMAPNTPANVIQSLQNFESQEYLELMDQRVSETADAMRAIAKYLGGYPGRKNLVWFSESFPIWIEPTTDFGSDPFIGSTTYNGKVREAADALTDAQVAVYPVDARALEGPQAYSAANGTVPSGDLGGALSREDSLRINSQATMDAIAEETGGKTCKNTNGLAGCVQEALNEGSAYYELAYYPENVKWDGHFQKITVKTPVHGVKLAYRRGFFAASTEMLANPGQPDQLLKQACIDPLPSTSIDMTVEPLAPSETPGQPAEPRYLLTVSPSALSLAPVDGARQLGLRMAICEYDPKGDKFEFFPRDLSRPVNDAAVKIWQEHGIRNIFDYGAKPENPRLRFAVLDVPTGIVGSVDVPAHPRDFGTIPGAPAPAPAAAPASGGAPPPSQISQAVAPLTAPPAAPAAPAAPAQTTVTTALTFRSSSGNVSKLDWGAGKVTYQGDLGVELGAQGFFQKFFAGQYHCEAGTLVSNDPKATTPPRLALVLRGATGPAVLIDLTGADPQYTGDLPVDPDARAFFSQVWKLAHCQAP
ncbi:MAG: VWA domain-containing protein [Candidatus Acidiferrales bacterium]